MKKESEVLQIILACRSLDVLASETYIRFSEKDPFDAGSRKFWADVARDELAHITFWDKVELFFIDDDDARLFEDPRSILKELDDTYAKVTNLKQKSKSIGSLTEALLVAFSLEIHLLHPAFEVFFQYMQAPLRIPEHTKEYSIHLNKFFKFATKRGEAMLEIGIFEDIVSRLVTMNKALAISSQLDPMTSVFNRRGLFCNMEILGHLAQRSDCFVGVIMIDIDDFKFINDTYGHKKGDDVIIGVSKILTSIVRKSDVVGRIGGEEFLIFLPDTDPENLGEVAEKVRKAVEEEKQWGVNITISVGAVYGKITESPIKEIENLIQFADKHLYKAKQNGKNMVSALLPSPKGI